MWPRKWAALSTSPLTGTSFGRFTTYEYRSLRSVDPFLHSSCQSVPIYFIISSPFPHQIAHSNNGIYTPSNTWFPGQTRVQNQNGISIGSTVFAQLTAEYICSYFTTDSRFQNCPFSWGDLDPSVIHGSLGPPEPTTQTVSRSVHPFSKAHVCDRTTDRHADRPRYWVCKRGCSTVQCSFWKILTEIDKNVHDVITSTSSLLRRS